MSGSSSRELTTIAKRFSVSNSAAVKVTTISVSIVSAELSERGKYSVFGANCLLSNSAVISATGNSRSTVLAASGVATIDSVFVTNCSVSNSAAISWKAVSSSIKSAAFSVVISTSCSISEFNSGLTLSVSGGEAVCSICCNS